MNFIKPSSSLQNPTHPPLSLSLLVNISHWENLIFGVGIWKATNPNTFPISLSFSVELYSIYIYIYPLKSYPQN